MTRRIIFLLRKVIIGRRPYTYRRERKKGEIEIYIAEGSIGKRENE